LTIKFSARLCTEHL